MSNSAATLDNPSLAQANIQRFYQGILNRVPDGAGLNAWTAAYESGILSYAQIEAAIIQSAETQTNVVPIIELYQAAFSRVPDQAGLAGWVQARDSGMSLPAIAQAFVNSPEFQTVHGASASDINASPAAKLAFVASLYQNILGRQGASSEVSSWANSGLTADQMLLGIATSPEATQKNAAAMTQFLAAAGNGTESYTGALSQQAPGAATLAAQLPPGSGAVTFAPGQYVTAGNVLQYDGDQAWSATAEVEFDGPAPGIGPDLPQGGAEVVFGDTSGAPYQGYELWEDDTGDLRVRIMSNYLAGSYIDVATTSPVSYGTMQFIGATYDGSGKAAGVSIYIDGQQAQTQVLSDTLSGSSASSEPMIVGNQLNGWQDQFNLQGSMAEFSLSNVERPASYFASSAQQGAFQIDANTQLAYGFAEGAGLTTQDLSGHGNNGVLSSATMWSQVG